MKQALVFILLFALVVQSFSDMSMLIDVSISPNARAHVVEQVQLSLEESEVYTYTTSMGAIKTTIADWKQLTNSEFLAYHTTASPVDQRILPQKPIYNPSTKQYTAMISVEYDTLENMTLIEEVGPRRTLYTLIPSRVAFKLSPTGDIVLPRFYTLRITIPAEAKIISANPQPDKIINNTLVWEGPYTLARFDVRFEIEQSLSYEVQSFFASLGSSSQYIILNYYSQIIILLVIVAVVKLRR